METYSNKTKNQTLGKRDMSVGTLLWRAMPPFVIQIGDSGYAVGDVLVVVGIKSIMIQSKNSGEAVRLPTRVHTPGHAGSTPVPATKIR